MLIKGLKLKNIVKSALWKTTTFQRFRYNQYHQRQKERYKHLEPDEIEELHYIALYQKSKAEQISDALSNVRITIRPGNRFQTWIDTGLEFVNIKPVIDNTSPDYSVVLTSSINTLIENYNNDIYSKSNFQFKIVLCAVKQYINRICKEIEVYMKAYPQDSYLQHTYVLFQRMLTHEAETIEEALQRILFWSSIFWQCKQRLIGLGRMDKLLQRFLPELKKKGASAIKEILKDFLTEMHRYYAFKSNSVAMGDTGQIIVLGGVEPDGSYFCNVFTYLFIEAVKELHLPDPKTLLRVSVTMPDKLLQSAIDSIATGIGCPLLANDDVVIPSLVEFGYEKNDACNYVTSACWEPLAYGMSLEVNNIFDINYAEVFNDTCQDDAIFSCQSFDEVLSLYCERLDKYFQHVLHKLSLIQWEENPLLSMFVLNCRKTGIDISQGGAKYNNYGILSVGLSNTVNSLMNIKKLVFDNKDYKLHELINAQRTNYRDSKDLKKKLSLYSYFGHDSEEVVTLIKKITGTLYARGEKFRNRFGGSVKWGLSSWSYAEEGKRTKATLDGRIAGEPLGVHISNSKSEPFTELVLFASKLNYSGNHSNGNVLDFFVAPQMLKRNSYKFLLFIKTAIKLGFFEMQMNVVNSEELRDALIHPEKHMDLIVRVWGFSAYFNDLPDYYKKLLIERAEESEKTA